MFWIRFIKKLLFQQFISTRTTQVALLTGAGVFLSEQNLRFLSDVCDHYLGIDAGKAIIDRSAADITSDEVRSALSL